MEDNVVKTTLSGLRCKVDFVRMITIKRLLVEIVRFRDKEYIHVYNIA